MPSGPPLIGTRIITALGAGYLALALLGHRLERKGRLRCECLPECWCKRGGIKLFRWVFPFRLGRSQKRTPRKITGLGD